MWENFPLFPDSASTVAGDVDAIYFAALAVAALFSLLIAVAVLYLAVKYKRTSPDQVGVPERANWILEIAWSVIPLGILLVLFWWGAGVFMTLSRPPAHAVEYYSIGKQWMWKFQHPEGNREINELHVPLGTAIKLTMTSEDVIHSFFVPAFRVKADVIPGRYTTVWFETTKTGTFPLYCTEYCGAEHSRMIGQVVVMEPYAYETWLTEGNAGRPVLTSGSELFTQLACHTCHRDDSAVRAPKLPGLFGTHVTMLDGSSVLVDEDYLRGSILTPAEKVVAGYQPVMPTYKGQITEDQLLQLVTYIKSLGAPAQPASGEQTSK
jgi:cytochrome c oxidase subunit II